MTSRSQVVLPSSSFSKPSNNNGDSLKHEQSGGLCNNKTRSTIFALPVVVMIGILYLYVEMTSFPKESASANLVGNQGLSFASASIAQNHDSNMTNLVNSAALQEGSASAAPKSYDSNAEQVCSIHRERDPSPFFLPWLSTMLRPFSPKIKPNRNG